MTLAKQIYEKTAIGSDGSVQVSGSGFEIDAFQGVVVDLDHLADEGLIEITFRHHEAQSGHRYVDWVKFKRLA